MACGRQAPTDIYNMTPSESLSILERQNVAIVGLWESTGHLSLASLSSCAALYGSASKNSGGGGNGMASRDRVLASFAYGPGLNVWGGGGRRMSGSLEGRLGMGGGAVEGNCNPSKNRQG